MTDARPSYVGQSLLALTYTLEGRNFFMPPNTEAVQLLEFLHAYYAQVFEIEQCLLSIMGDVVQHGVNDIHGRYSLFRSTVFSVYVKTMNTPLGRRGSMIQPGSGEGRILVDREGELEALVGAATLPAVDIMSETRGWAGTIFTPEDAGKKRVVKRPSCLNPNTYPDQVEYVVAVSKFQKEDEVHVVRNRFKRLRKREEKKLAAKNKSEGKRYIGPIRAQRRSPNAIPKTPPRRPPRRVFVAKNPELLEAAKQLLHDFRHRYRQCLEALRRGDKDIVWPAGTNYHHYVNGFKREPGGPFGRPPDVVSLAA